MRVNGIRMTPAERRAGRLMRAPDHTAGTDSGGGGNNGGGNAGGAATGNQGENNSGQSFNPDTFWNPPAAGDSGTPSGGSAGSGTQAAGTQGNQTPGDQGQQIGQRFASQLQNLNFNPVFNTDIANQIADGNLDGVNGAIAQLGRDSVRNAVTMSAELMQVYGQHIMTQVQSMIQDALGGRDNDQALMQEFPQAAANPAIRPMITSIFAQSMKHTNNDRQKAIAMTRDMLKFVGQGVGQELGLNEAPGNSGDNIGSGALSLVEELMAR